jgi:hypothetical protein
VQSKGLHDDVPMVVIGQYSTLTGHIQIQFEPFQHDFGSRLSTDVCDPDYINQLQLCTVAATVAK